MLPESFPWYLHARRVPRAMLSIVPLQRGLFGYPHHAPQIAHAERAKAHKRARKLEDAAAMPPRKRIKRAVAPKHTVPPPTDYPERFVTQCTRSLSRHLPCPESCVMWVGTRDRFHYGGRQNLSPARLSYEIYHQTPLPPNARVRCRCTRSHSRGTKRIICVNPTHLYVNSTSEKQQQQET